MTGAFDDSAKEEIRLRADIGAVVGRYVRLRPAGATLKGLCPFHKEKTPSFHVNPARGFFHCFGCGKGGDVFRFLQEMEGYSFPEALKLLADETGVELKPARQYTESGVGPTSSFPRARLAEINMAAADFFYAQIRSAPAAVEYFKSRGLAAETVRDFRLGFAPSGWSTLLSLFEGRKVPREALVACGLIVQKDDGNAYDRFRNRVMFTLTDLSGRVVGFAGRGMEKDATPKYLNSPETALYSKKGFLYGLNMTRQHIKDERMVLVVEGYMDFLSLYQAGIRNVVATSGTAMTVEHGHLLRRFAPRVVLVFDGDEAGQHAAERGVFTLAPLDLDVAVLVLTADEDPDSFVRSQGADAFRALCAQARTANDFLIDRTIAELGGTTPRSQKAAIERLSPLFCSLCDELARSRFRKDLAERLGVDEGLVGRMLQRPSGRKDESPVIPDINTYFRSLEGGFLHILISQPSLIAEARQYIAAETITDAVSADIYSTVLAHFDEHGDLDDVLNRLHDEEIRRLVSRMLVDPVREEHIHEELVQKIIHLRRKHLKARIRTNRSLLKAGKSAEDGTDLVSLINSEMKQLAELDERE